MISKRGSVQIEFLKRSGTLTGPDAAVVLNGASVAGFSRAWKWLTQQSSASPLLVAVDGGLATCRRAGRKPDLFVGDADSATRRPRDLPAIVFPQDKTFSDLSGTLRELARRKVAHVAVAGLLGGRLDHEWANVSELGAFASRFTGIIAMTPRATIAITSVGCRARMAQRRTVSVFALNGVATVSLRGTRWELRRRKLQPGSEGLSNLCEREVELTVHTGSVGFMVLPRT